MWDHSGWVLCTCNARRANRGPQKEIGKAVDVNEHETTLSSTRRRTAIDMRQMAHSDVCVEALSSSFLAFVRLRSRWCVCLLAIISSAYQMVRSALT